MLANNRENFNPQNKSQVDSQFDRVSEVIKVGEDASNYDNIRHVVQGLLKDWPQSSPRKLLAYKIPEK